MKTPLIIAACLFPAIATAAIPYRVEQTGTTSVSNNQIFAHDHMFYIGGAYNFAMWQSASYDGMHIGGKNSSGFDVSAGFRPYDIFRIEAQYIHAQPKWNEFSLKTDAAFLNMIVDARIDALYRIFRHQTLVPYVGFGAGAAWNSPKDVTIDHKVSPAAAALAGISVEMGEYFAVDFGYRYFYMFSPKFDGISDYSPAAHQFRAGARVNF